MIVVSRGASSVWKVRVSSRASTSLLTVDRTSASGISWRLTSTVARAVHRLGRNIAIETAAARTKRNGSTASRRRRRRTSRIEVRPGPRLASSCSVGGVVGIAGASGHHDHVAGAQREVVLAGGADGAVVVEAQALGLPALAL